MPKQAKTSVTDTPPTPDSSAPKRATRRPRADGLATTKRVISKGKVIVIDEQPSSAEVQLRKAVEAIIVRNVGTTGEITFLQRKVYNAMLHIAQRTRINDQMTFEVPIAQFEELVGHNDTNNRQYLKEILRSLTKMQVEFDYKGEGRKHAGGWGIANMVAEVYISPDGQRVRYSFPPDLSKKLLDPEIFNRIDMRMQAQFGSYSALTLFETVSRYATSEMRETFRAHWTDWSMLLSGAATPHSQFRDFNKLMLRAVDHVNQRSQQYRVVPHLSKRQRKMDQLWFYMEPLEQPSLALISPAPMVGDEIKAKLRSFGLSDSDITPLAMQYDEEYLLAQADYTAKREKKKGAAPLTNPKAFYLKAVEENYAAVPLRQPAPVKTEALPDTKQKAAKTSARQTMGSIAELWRAHKIKELREVFISQSEEKKLEIIDGVLPQLQQNTVAWTQYQKKGLTRTVETTVIDLIFQKNCPPPTAEELLQFAIESGTLVANVASA